MFVCFAVAHTINTLHNHVAARPLPSNKCVQKDFLIILVLNDIDMEDVKQAASKTVEVVNQGICAASRATLASAQVARASAGEAMDAVNQLWTTGMVRARLHMPSFCSVRKPASTPQAWLLLTAFRFGLDRTAPPALPGVCVQRV